jgi:metallophosphoesterase superfamily enzyme
VTVRVHEDWLLTPQRAAVHLPTATAVVADLHLGYDQARRRGGEAVPDVGLEETVALLGALLAGRPVRRLVVAGDLIEDGRGVAPAAELLAWLRAAGVELAGVVPGNHDRWVTRSGDCATTASGDRATTDGDAGLLPICPDGFALGRWRVVHGDGPLPEGPVVYGHFHPCLRLSGRAAPCYLVSDDHLVLPAFSADAAGVNVLGQRRWRSFRCLVPVADQVLDFGEVGKVRNRVGK